MLVTPIGVSAKIWVASGSGDSNLYVIDETGATIETVGDTGEYFTGLAYSVGERFYMVLQAAIRTLYPLYSELTPQPPKSHS